MTHTLGKTLLFIIGIGVVVLLSVLIFAFWVGGDVMDMVMAWFKKE
ncbi:hypothetical protein [Jeotgalibacillus campisalis]|uniref:Uncharacterized protein n=1 Tax=Jeotgalibacillus campisalis TaxID=220754 RepID=A0A0C2WA62_9BACL|nr:hypothetical protein [Jeotgalibacillus campisalis]KIL52938.1 hypothetical protein KR50_02670 [Jeotgalibacillus campisalis]